MSADFDPYYRWLAIPPAEQPAHYYRLLGTQLFEENFKQFEGTVNDGVKAAAIRAAA